jgi:hypothetical protein
MFINDEYLGETCIGTWQQFKKALQELAREWWLEEHRAAVAGFPAFDEYLEGLMLEHLRPANAREIAEYPPLED